MPLGAADGSGPVTVPERVQLRAWKYVLKGDPNACWPWQASLGSHGYGQIGWKGNDRMHGTTAHRAIWVSLNGQIPDGMTIDHKCRNRVCCNPSQLRLLSNYENAKDNGFAKRTHCPHGHPYSPENTRVNDRGHRFCRECARQSKRVA